MQKPRRTYVCIDEAAGRQQQRRQEVQESAFIKSNIRISPAGSLGWNAAAPARGRK